MDYQQLAIDEIEDIERIVRVCRENGFKISFTHALKIHTIRSREFEVGWLVLEKSDNELFAMIKPRIIAG